MALYQYGNSSKAPPPREGLTEFEILRAKHRFLREDDNSEPLSWEEQLALKYYSSLYREFAVCDLKHYKSGNFALRWRTESEVLSGAGETTCGNTRCQHHHPLPEYLQRSAPPPPKLTTLELPFAYVEHGETRSALVKVVLCPKCFDKLMWKRRKEKEKVVELTGTADEEKTSKSGTLEDGIENDGVTVKVEVEDEDAVFSRSRVEERHRSKHRGAQGGEGGGRRRSSRSRSPRTSSHQQDSKRPRHDGRSGREQRHRRSPEYAAQ